MWEITTYLYYVGGAAVAALCAALLAPAHRILDAWILFGLPMILSAGLAVRAYALDNVKQKQLEEDIKK